MKGFGRPQFKGAPTQKPFSTRPTLSNRSGLLGEAPSQSSVPSQYNSYQGNKPEGWMHQRSASSGSLLGNPPGHPSDRNSASSKSAGSMVPSEVRKLMQTLGLSQEDMEKLSQLPENELSASRLVAAIDNLKQQKQQLSEKSSYKQHSFSAPSSSSNSYKHETRRSYDGGNDGLLGARPRQQTSANSGYGFDRNSEQNRSSFSPASQYRPKGNNVTSRSFKGQFNRTDHADPHADSNFADQHKFSRNNQHGDYYDESTSSYGGRSPDRYDHSRNDSFSQNDRRQNYKHVNEREGQSSQNYDNQRRRGDRGHQNQQDQNTRGKGLLPRPSATKNLPALMQLKTQPSGGLLGNPMSPNAHGLESLAAAVGGGSSLLSPLVLASQADPSVLEAQIQAMKILQTHALKLKEQDSYNNQSGGRQSRNRPPPRRRSPPSRSRAVIIDKQLEEEARKEAEEMRASKGRVLYIKFKSPRVTESDLKQLASPFGKVTKLLLIKPKIKNGHFQVFMELDQYDCAAAMLEHYMAKAPNVKGCPVDVKRSNYADLQLRSDQSARTKRPRSISPVREGTTQLSKRGRISDDLPKLSITTDQTDRKVIANEEEEIDADDSYKKIDAREILNRSRANKPESSTVEGTEGTSELNTSADVEEMLMENPDAKEEIDPLDEIADELALSDEFAMMDEVRYGGERKKKDEAKAEENKDAVVDLERTDLDLDNVNVDENQSDHVAGANKDDTTKHTPNTSQSLDDKVDDIPKVFIKTEDDENELSDKQRSSNAIDDAACNNDLKKIKEEIPVQSVVKASDMEQTEVIKGTCGDVSEDNKNKSTKVEDDDQTEIDVNEEEDEDDISIPDSGPIIEGSLKEVIAAKYHLESLTKVTKAKAALVLAKKIKGCLDIAINLLESAE